MIGIPSVARVRAAWPARGQPLPMVWSSIGLMGGRALSLVFGFVFWLLAARLATASSVGLTAGAISAVMFGVQFALFGVGAAFVSQHRDHGSDNSRLIDTALFLVTFAAAVFACGFLLLASGVFTELAVVATVPSYAALFIAMVIFGTVGVLFDYVAAADRRGDRVVVRELLNGLVTVTPLAVALLVGRRLESFALFGFWVGGGLASCGWGLVQLVRAPGGYRPSLRFDRRLAMGLVRLGAPNHVLTLAERAPGLLLPIVVIELLSPTVNAYWYATWMMALAVYMVPISVGLALFAETARGETSAREDTAKALRSSLALGVLAGGLIAALADPVLSLLGRDYASVGVVPLRVLVVAVVPIAVVQAYFAVCRATGRLGEAIWTGTAAGLASIGGIAMVARAGGLRDMASAWVVAQLATGAWAAWRLRIILRTPGRPVIDTMSGPSGTVDVNVIAG